MAGSVSSTSRIRPAETAARGTMTNMITAVMTANRICMMYCRNAVRLPIGMAPQSTRMRAEPDDRDREQVHDQHQRREA